MAMTHHTGSCQCGAVAFEADVDLDSTITCDCSRCRRLGSVLAFTPPDQFKLLRGAGAMTPYQFNKHAISHQFCKICGIQPLACGKKPDGTAMVAINANCLDGVDARALPSKHVHGSASWARLRELCAAIAVDWPRGQPPRDIGDAIMTTSKTLLLATGLLLGAASFQPAMAEDGRNGAAAAGVIGGLAAGAIIGGALGNGNGNGTYDDGEGRRYRRRHAYVQERRQVRVCHTERRQTENEDGDIFIRRVRVCE